ncbi:unnamed protein product, partial [Natator depressus]
GQGYSGQGPFPTTTRKHGICCLLVPTSPHVETYVRALARVVGPTAIVAASKMYGKVVFFFALEELQEFLEDVRGSRNKRVRGFHDLLLTCGDWLELPLTLAEFSEALYRMPTNKSPGIDGLTVEFYRVLTGALQRSMVATEEADLLAEPLLHNPQLRVQVAESPSVHQRLVLAEVTRHVLQK